MLVRLPVVFRFPTTIRPSSPQVTAAADTLMLKIHISYLPADTYLLGDPAGGGFHRYSVDEFWHIPHFEKVIAWRGNAPQHVRTPVQANKTARSLPSMWVSSLFVQLTNSLFNAIDCRCCTTTRSWPTAIWQPFRRVAHAEVSQHSLQECTLSAITTLRHIAASPVPYELGAYPSRQAAGLG